MKTVLKVFGIIGLFVLISFIVFIGYIFFNASGAMGTISNYEGKKEKYSKEYNIPQENITYAFSFSLANDYLRTFIVDISSDNYKKFVPEGLLLTKKDQIKGGLEGSALFVMCEELNNETHSDLWNMICSERDTDNNSIIPENALIYQKDITNYEFNKYPNRYLSYVVLLKHNLIWVSDFHY